MSRLQESYVSSVLCVQKYKDYITGRRINIAKADFLRIHKQYPWNITSRVEVNILLA